MPSGPASLPAFAPPFWDKAFTGALSTPLCSTVGPVWLESLAKPGGKLGSSCTEGNCMEALSSGGGMSEVEDGRLMALPSCCAKPRLSAAVVAACTGGVEFRLAAGMHALTLLGQRAPDMV